MQALNKDDVAALSRKFFSEYAGGRVFEAKRGLWRNVFVWYARGVCGC